ncbi:MAG TPA: DNA starvation/stationary phase protection protein [Bacilli bacterium]|nr:DNA starvation/stationary phase protection protein [Bacilli bacterium]
MKLQEKLNVFVANQTVLYTKLHNLHWYVTGPTFFVLHAKFEELYDETTEVMDEVAERLLAIGGKPVASLKEVLALTTIQEFVGKDIVGKDAVQVILADYKALLKDAKELRNLAAEADDPSTEDLFIGYRANYEKTIWMLEALLK